MSSNEYGYGFPSSQVPRLEAELKKLNDESRSQGLEPVWLVPDPTAPADNEVYFRLIDDAGRPLDTETEGTVFSMLTLAVGVALKRDIN